jgi:hypothetical protein
MKQGPGYSQSNGPEIGDMDEGIIKGGEDAGYTEDIFACAERSISQVFEIS